MPELEVSCPSGLRGTIRGWKTKEAEILASRKLTRDGSAFNRMLANCWLTTVDSGPYPSNGALDWNEVLLCDRFWALLRIRAATYGDSYAFDVQCEDRRSCGARIEWELNLSELPFKPLPEASREKIKAGSNRFETQLSDGRSVFFSLTTGRGEAAAMRLLSDRSARVIVSALAARVIEIEGVEKEGLMGFLDELDLHDLVGLMDAFDDHDGGTETVIEVECDRCGLLQDVELPLDRQFFLPRRRRRSFKHASANQ